MLLRWLLLVALACCVHPATVPVTSRSTLPMFDATIQISVFVAEQGISEEATVTPAARVSMHKAAILFHEPSKGFFSVALVPTHGPSAATFPTQASGALVFANEASVVYSDGVAPEAWPSSTWMGLITGQEFNKYACWLGAAAASGTFSTASLVTVVDGNSVAFQGYGSAQFAAQSLSALSQFGATLTPASPPRSSQFVVHTTSSGQQVNISSNATDKNSVQSFYAGLLQWSQAVPAAGMSLGAALVADLSPQPAVFYVRAAGQVSNGGGSNDIFTAYAMATPFVQFGRTDLTLTGFPTATVPVSCELAPTTTPAPTYEPGDLTCTDKQSLTATISVVSVLLVLSVLGNIYVYCLLRPGMVRTRSARYHPATDPSTLEQQLLQASE